MIDTVREEQVQVTRESVVIHQNRITSRSTYMYMHYLIINSHCAGNPLCRHRRRGSDIDSSHSSVKLDDHTQSYKLKLTLDSEMPTDPL